MNKFMYEVGQSFKREFRDFVPELRQRVQDSVAERIEEACFYERQNNILTAVCAMRDAGVDEDVIIQMLQRHWDLRRSEAIYYLSGNRQQIADAEMVS